MKFSKTLRTSPIAKDENKTRLYSPKEIHFLIQRPILLYSQSTKYFIFVINFFRILLTSQICLNECYHIYDHSACYGKQITSYTNYVLTVSDASVKKKICVVQVTRPTLNF